MLIREAKSLLLHMMNKIKNRYYCGKGFPNYNTGNRIGYMNTSWIVTKDHDADNPNTLFYQLADSRKGSFFQTKTISIDTAVNGRCRKGKCGSSKGRCRKGFGSKGRERSRSRNKGVKERRKSIPDIGKLGCSLLGTAFFCTDRVKCGRFLCWSICSFPMERKL